MFRRIRSTHDFRLVFYTGVSDCMVDHAIETLEGTVKRGVRSPL